jgi:hypothetical protein
MLHPPVVADAFTAWEQRFANGVVAVPNFVDIRLRKFLAVPTLWRAGAPAAQ